MNIKKIEKYEQKYRLSKNKLKEIKENLLFALDKNNNKIKHHEISNLLYNTINTKGNITKMYFFNK